MGLTLEELDQMEEGQVMDLLIEQGNDMVADEVYTEVADQAAFDAFWTFSLGKFHPVVGKLKDKTVLHFIILA